MPALYLALVLGLTCAITASLRAAVGPADAPIATMPGMMLSMTAGMMTGLIAGTGAPLIVGGDLWPATLLGICAGLAAGLLTGLPVGLLALLDGSMAGLMGGMMGAMLGVMAPAAIAPALLLLVTLYFLAHAGLVLHLSPDARTADAPRSSPRTRLLLLLVALLGLAILGGMLGTYASAISGSPLSSRSPYSRSMPQEILPRTW